MKGSVQLHWFLPRNILESHPSFSSSSSSASHYKTSLTSVRETPLWLCGSRRDNNTNISWQTKSPSVPYAVSYFDLGKPQKDKTGQFFHVFKKHIYMGGRGQCGNVYLRGTFVKLFNIMNHLLTGTPHKLEAMDNIIITEALISPGINMYHIWVCILHITAG